MLSRIFEKKASASLGGGAMQLASSKFITIAIGTVSSMLMARLRTQHDYGTYSALILSINTVTTLLLMGLPNSINYFLARASSKEQKQHFLSVYYTFSTLLSVLIGICLVAALPWVITFFDNPDLAHYAYFLAVCPWIYITNGCVDHLLIAYSNTRALAKMRIANSVLLLSIIPLAELFGGTLAFRFYMVFYVCVEGAFALVCYLFAKRFSGSLSIRFDFKLLRRILSFSLPLGLATSVSTLNSEIDKLFVGANLSPSDLAIYDYGARSLPFQVIPLAITSVLTPLIVRMIKKRQTAEAVRLWNRVVEFSFGILCFATVILIAFAPQVVKLLYSEKYIECVEVFIIFRLTLLLKVTYFGMLLNATGRTKFIFFSSCCSLLVNVVLNSIFFFCTDLGTVGLAMVTVISQTAMNLAQLLATCHVLSIPFSKIMPWGRMGSMLLVSGSLGGIGFCALRLLLGILPNTVPNLDIILAVVLGAILSLVYLCLYRRYIVRLWKFINSFKMANAAIDDAEADKA